MTPSDEEVAKLLVKRFDIEEYEYPAGKDGYVTAYFIILESLREQRKQVIEECAKVAESLEDDINRKESEFCIAYKEIASAIRKLIGD